MRALLTALLLLSTVPALAGGAGPRPAPTTESAAQREERLTQAIQEAEQVRQAGQPLRALVLLERVVRDAGPGGVADLARQVLGSMQAEVGAHREALASFAFGPGASPPLSPQEERRVAEARLVDAVDAIVAASQGRQVVILNEAHHVPQGREFARRLALALRREGFSYFAGETFRPGVESTTAGGFVTRDSGYYTADPVYAELVRGVLGAGYTLVPYEAETFGQGGTPAGQINDRERQQAQNLVDRIFRKDPAARVFIYVGYSHNLEEPQSRQGETVKWMALRLRELTGMDPLTVDQTAGLSTGEASRDDPVRRAVVALKGPRVPSVLQDPQGQPVRVTPFQRNDLQVFHPDPVPVGGRPGWLSGGGRVPARVRIAGWTGGGRRLVQAFHAGGPADAIPADQFLIRAGGEVTLLLMPGAYRLAVQDEAGRTVPLGPLTVR